MTNSRHLIAISVGNTRTQIGRFIDEHLEEVESCDHAAPDAIVEKIAGWSAARATDDPAPLLALASVNDEVADGIIARVEAKLGDTVHRVGDGVPIPVPQQLEPETITGTDRLLNAAAAFRHVRQACIIVDAGTAVTVDFVDGEGTFHGGAIAPGARMQLDALHRGTSALPDVAFRRPEGTGFGRSTAEAMLRGVFVGIRGMVWKLVEEYAETYGAYPMVIATGGDAEILFGDDELVDRVVPGLTLMGIAGSVRAALTVDDADADVRN
ncbi:MAG: type III pantothenate kinase [Planctomycetes bacterium]|nr:type III pantothenate kinase [Planctomycetota bacterium]